MTSHNDSTYTMPVKPLGDFTFADLLDTYYKFKNGHGEPVKALRVAPNVFKRLNRYLEDEQVKREREGVKATPAENVWLTKIYRMDVTVDPSMMPGTWKFVV